jgi:hypothetical protein
MIKGGDMTALKAFDSPKRETPILDNPIYTNFPTVQLAGHTLLLRRSWPEDILNQDRENSVSLINHFGTTGEVLELSDGTGQTIAAQWIQVHRNDPLPESGSSAWPGSLSSLRTALRYSRLGWLEIGPLRTLDNTQLTPMQQALVPALMWQGIQRLLERNGLGFALGLACLPPSDADAPVTDMVPTLLERYGLDPEFGYQPRKFPGMKSAYGNTEKPIESCLPVDLREALRRGARLCGEPYMDSQGHGWFFWAFSVG